MAPTDSGLPGAKLIGKPQKVLKKGRKKGAVKELKTELRVWVPGHVLAATFEERKKAGAEVAQTESATTSLRGAPSAEKQSAATMKYEAAVPG